MKLSHILTILLGLVLVAVLAPLTQFMTISTVNMDAETATPLAWAVGILFSIVLALGTVRAIAKIRLVSKPNLVILYCMLTVAVPVMNLGLVRPAYMSMQAVMREYLLYGTNTYRTAYNSLTDEWFPVVPTREGVAWLKGDRLLTLLRDDQAVKATRGADRKLRLALIREAQRQKTATTQPAPPTRDELLEWVSKLTADNASTILSEKKRWTQKDLRSLGILTDLAQRKENALATSAEAAEKLPGMLDGIDEFEASLLEKNWEALDLSSRDRIISLDAELRLAEERRQRTADFRDRAEELGATIASLTRTDWAKVRGSLKQAYLARFEQMPQEAVDALRHNMVFRMKTSQRKEMLTHDGTAGTVDQNFQGFSTGPQRKGTTDERYLPEKFDEAAESLPWHLWAKPILMWSSLFLAIFLLLMCISEWLRRKWIDRENLAFPLVEVADHIIRHDSELETSSDFTDPAPRKWPVNPVFMLGFAIGLFWVGIEALAHYGFITGDYSVYFQVSKELFTTGDLKQADKVFLVISPIVLGIGFLVSLEISFSVWAIFFLYTFVVMVGKNSYPDLKDSLFTGWAGGKQYPFPTEQMLGACICFAGIVLFKTFRGRKRAKGPQAQDYFIPPRLNTIGLIVLPLVVLALLWSHGVAGTPAGMAFVIGMAFIAFVQMITAARVRAETGLPSQHVSYEFTKAPMVFGLTGFTGAKVFAMFVTIAYLPLTLLMRMIPQHLENMELARRHKLQLRTVAVASLGAAVVAIVVGMLVFPIFAYAVGGSFYGEGVEGQGQSSRSIAHYSLWISHYLGEEGLDKWTQIHWVRIGAIAVGFGVVALLAFLRGRFLRFPLHPIGYLLILLSIYYAWVSPYHTGSDKAPPEASWLWGSIFMAWLIKKGVIKYGGMNTYRKAKPLFIGLVVGAVMCVFLFNGMDLICSWIGANQKESGSFIRHFLDTFPYSPVYY